MSWPNWLPIREQLRELSPYGAPQIDVPVRLNTNENPYQLSQSLQEGLANRLNKVLADLNRYPDRDAVELRGQLGESVQRETGVQLDQRWIWAANGSNEIIQSIALAFDGDGLGFVPSYSMQPLILQGVGKRWHSRNRGANFEVEIDGAIDAISSTGARLVFLTTPNNPTGNSTPIDQIQRLAQACLASGALLIVDEAYAEFSDEPSAITLISKHPNILVTRTMSKAYAFAGARLGYLVADPRVIEAMFLVRLPYHLSSLTQAAALAALSLHDELSRDVARLRQSRDELADQMRALGLLVWPSQANFLLFSGFARDAKELWEFLVSQGVLVRDVGIPGHLRVTIGTSSENQRFLASLAAALKG